MSVKWDPKRAPETLAVICSSASLEVGGIGVRFEVGDENCIWPAFVVRHSKGVAAYINRCAHLDLELDWDLGLFFDVDQQHLICATHGALYTADTGKCVSGPCNGLGLEVLQAIETEGSVYLNDPRYALYRALPDTQG